MYINDSYFFFKEEAVRKNDPWLMEGVCKSGTTYRNDFLLILIKGFNLFEKKLMQFTFIIWSATGNLKFIISGLKTVCQHPSIWTYQQKKQVEQKRRFFNLVNWWQHIIFKKKSKTWGNINASKKVLDQTIVSWLRIKCKCWKLDLIIR